jgi:hypothetical protein
VALVRAPCDIDGVDVGVSSMSRLISVRAIISAELQISTGAPTVNDIVLLLNKGNYHLDVYEPRGSDLSIVVREKRT